MAAVNPGGTTFCLAAGTYSITRDIEPKSDQKFVGALGPNGERLTIITGNDTAKRAVFAPDASVQRVEFRNVVFERFASDLQQSPFSLSWPPQDQFFVFDNVESRYNWAWGMDTSSNTTVRNSYSHHNGQLGIGGQGGGTVENTELAYNNWQGKVDALWEAGGGKWVNNNGLVVRNVYSHDNCGPGLWTDGYNENVVYENNRVVNNHGPGIFHEIGGAARVSGNTATGNAWGDLKSTGTGKACATSPPGGKTGYGGGILVATSHDVEVYGNTVSGNDGGVVLIYDNRSDSPGSGTFNVSVHDNDMTLGADSDYRITGCYDNTGTGKCATSNNSWNRNVYHAGTVANPFRWLNGDRTWTQWRSYGFDAAGSID
jgi:parallel beta-helix repeat protein